MECLEEQQRVLDVLREPWIVLECACGDDHEVWTCDVGFDGDSANEVRAYLVCPLHARHIPCRRCLYGSGGRTHRIVEVGDVQVAAPVAMTTDEIEDRVRSVCRRR